MEDEIITEINLSEKISTFISSKISDEIDKELLDSLLTPGERAAAKREWKTYTHRRRAADLADI